MTDPLAEGLVHESGEGAPFVIRLSRNASGARTYTVGATLGRDETPEAVVEVLFSIERLVAAGMAGEKVGRGTGEQGESMIALLRRSLIVGVLKVPGWPKYGESNSPESDMYVYPWITTAEIVSAIPGAHRSQVVADLKALTAQGIVEYKRGKGGKYPSTYRLVNK